jgi:L-lactate dehydrogenase complex protein LldG
MSSARERILGSIQRSLVRAVLPDASSSAPAIAQRAAIEGAALVQQFTAALEALKGRVHAATDAAAAAEVVAGIAAEYGATTYIAWDEASVGCPGLTQVLAAKGITRVPYDVPADPGARRLAMERLGAITLGITGADAALADAGAIVLAAGPGRGRLVSVLPPVHVAIVGRDQLVANLGTLLQRRPGLLDEASNVVIIAGPSRTADIEMTLSHGVHGPKHVHVVLVG